MQSSIHTSNLEHIYTNFSAKTVPNASLTIAASIKRKFKVYKKNQKIFFCFADYFCKTGNAYLNMVFREFRLALFYTNKSHSHKKMDSGKYGYDILNSIFSSKPFFFHANPIYSINKVWLDAVLKLANEREKMKIDRNLNNDLTPNRLFSSF